MKKNTKITALGAFVVLIAVTTVIATVILVLHEINYAAFYSDYICAFVDGKIAKFGTVDEVINKECLRDVYNVDFEIIRIDDKPLSVYY